ncbi:MAG: PAS domain S-box protein [Kiloniellales bacterium]|nr:PAS domain S-box protein [Kiloniellales bacterium]
MTPRSVRSGLLGQILWRVLPVSIVLLLAIWYGAAEVMRSSVEDEVRGGLRREADHRADAIATRIAILQDAARALAANDLIVNSLVDTIERESYLSTFFQSLRMPGPAGAIITLTDYRGRAIASTGRNISYQAGVWLSEVMEGNDAIRLAPSGLIIAVPVVYEGLPEGILVVEYLGSNLGQFFGATASMINTIVVHDSGFVLFSSIPELANQWDEIVDVPLGDWVRAETRVPGQSEVSVITVAERAAAFKTVDQVETIMLIAIAVSILALVGGILLAALLATRPLAGLIDQIQSIGRAGDLKRRVKDFRSHEFQRLADSFNGMIARLEQTTVSRDRVDNILNSMAELVVVTDRQGRIRAANRAAQQLFGQPVPALRGRPILDFLRDGETGEEVAALAPARVSERVQFLEAVCVTGADVRLPVAVSAAPLEGGEGEAEAILYVALDIADLKKAQSDQAEAERRLRTAIESISEGFALFDADDRLIVFNSKYKEIYGESAEAIEAGARFEDIIRFGVERGQYAEALGRVEDFVRERVAQHQDPGAPLEQQLGDGRWLRIEERRTEDGGVVGIRTDITALKGRETRLQQQARELERSNAEFAREVGLRRAVETSLRESEIHSRAIFEMAEDAIVMIDWLGRIERLNPAAERLLGYEAQELLGKNVKVLMPEPYRSAHDDHLRRYLSGSRAKVGGRVRKLVAQRRDGTTLPIELSLGEVILGGRRFFIGAIRDVGGTQNKDRLPGPLHPALDSELRPALASILGDLQLLRQGAAGRLPGKAKRKVEAAEAAGARALAQLDELVAWSNGEVEDEAPAPAPRERQGRSQAS